MLSDNFFKIYHKIIMNYFKFYETFLMYAPRPEFPKIFLKLFQDLLEIFQYFFKIPPLFFHKITPTFPLHIIIFFFFFFGYSATRWVKPKSAKALWVRREERQITLRKWKERLSESSKGEWTRLLIRNLDA